MRRGPPPSLRGRALMWLAQREHTRQELAQKLQRWAKALHTRAAASPLYEPLALPGAGEIDALLDKLQADGHLSNQRFVESRVNARQARFGNRRIEQELRRHGAVLDESSRAQLRASEVERARRVWLLKYGQPALDPAGRARQMRFLAGRGFSADVIRRVVTGGGDDDMAADGAPEAEA